MEGDTEAGCYDIRNLHRLLNKGVGTLQTLFNGGSRESEEANRRAARRHLYSFRLGMMGVCVCLMTME